MSKYNKVNPTPAEFSFREIIKDQVPGVDVKKLIHTLKNINRFPDLGIMKNTKNIFDNFFVSKTERCKVVHDAIRNPLTRAQFQETLFTRESYKESLTGLVIPIELTYDHHIEKARLVISAIPNHPVVVAFQYKLYVTDQQWITIYAKQSTLMRSMYATVYDHQYY